MAREEVQLMSETVVRILAQLGALSLQERAELAHAVLCSLEPEEPGVAEAWDEELARRVARLRSGQAMEVAAEEVFANWRRNAP
jgi:putative addiction module component (TIGR02574 family)